MIPDKIYVREYQDGEYTTWWDEKPHEEESIGMKAVCYIRKEALLEWANGELMPGNSAEGKGWNLALQTLIDKLNSM